MLAVNWSESALHDVEIIMEYFLAKDTPAERVRDLTNYLLSLSKRIAVLPGKGALGKVPGTRELRDAKSRCRLIYEINPVRVCVLRILHDEMGFADHDNFVAMTQASISPTKRKN